MIKALCYIFIFIAEALTALLYFDRIFSEKTHSTRAKFLSFSCGYMFLLLCSGIENIEINGTAFFIVNFLIVLISYRTKIVTGLLHVGYMNIIMFGTELLVALALSRFTADFSAYLYEDEVTIAFSILSRLVYFSVMQFSTRLFRVKNAATSDYSLTLLSVFPVSSIFVGFAICFICLSANLSKSIRVLLVFTILILLLSNILIMLIYGRVQRIDDERLHYAVQAQKENAKAEYYQMMQEQMSNQRILIHDIKRHIQSISCLLEEKSYPELEKYIDALNTSTAFLSVRLSEEPVMNSILSRYQKLCQDESIDYDVDVRHETVSSMYKEDITSLFDNLLSNAYEAAKSSVERYIMLTVRNEDDNELLIKLVNSCGIPPIKNANGKYVTTKKDTVNHGFGLNSIENCVQRYGGHCSMVYSEEEKTFTTIIIMQKRRQTE